MNLFSRLQSGNKNPDGLTYELPLGMRNQIVQIWEKGFGPDDRYHAGPGMAYKTIYRAGTRTRMGSLTNCPWECATKLFKFGKKDLGQTTATMPVPVWLTKESTRHFVRNISYSASHRSAPTGFRCVGSLLSIS